VPRSVYAHRGILMQCIIQTMAALDDARIEDFNLSGVVNRAVKYWWVVALLMIVGGITGLLVSVIAKPVYESNSVISTVIDFAYSGRMTDYEEDYLLTVIGDIVLSDAVMTQVVEAASNDNLAVEEKTLLAGLTASRQGFRWALSSRYSDAQVAQEVNRLWLKAAMNELQAFRSDSLAALAEFHAQVGIENCFEQSVVLDPATPYCSAQDMDLLQRQLENLADGSLRADLLTRLLASRVSFEVTGEPDLPSRPVHLGRNISTLAGAMVGMLLALIVLITGFPFLKDPGTKQ